MTSKIELYHNGAICFKMKKIDNIIVEGENMKYSITLDDLFKYLKSKHDNSSSKIVDIDIDTILNITQTNDKFMRLTDKDLIYFANRLLNEARKKNISEYYKKSFPDYNRSFNLRGLVYNNRIINESQRKTIRDLCRKCENFLNLIQNKLIDPTNYIISSPVPPIVTSSPVPPIVTSSPVPPIVTSSPVPPIVISPPVPPIVTSSPVPPIVTSSPVPPIVISPPVPPIVTQECVVGKKDDDDNAGYIYVLREREFIMLKQDVYKIGRTKNFIRRFSQYPKNSEFIFVCKVIDDCKIETQILRILKKKLKHRKDIGKEYFECEQNLLLEIVKKLTNSDNQILNLINPEDM
jgi:hypothetical protein